MRNSRFLTRVLATALITALPLSAIASGNQPLGCVPPGGTWATRTVFPNTVSRALGAFFPANGKFYVLGGRFADGAGNELMQPSEYDPVLDSWATKTGTFDDNQINNMVGGVLDFGGTPFIVTVGGSAGGATTATSEVRQYDPVADVLTALTLDPWPGNTDGAILPGGAAVFGNKLYVFGGFDIAIGMVSTIYQFDPAAAAGSRWTLMTATLPNPIGYVPAATSGNLIYLFGGSTWDPVNLTILDSSESSIYDPVADTLSTAVATIPRATAETHAVTQIDGKVWVLGGGRDAPNPSNEVDVYDPVGDAWSLGPAFAAPRRNFATDIDPALGNIWATGGYDVDGTTLLSTNEQFTTCTIPSDLIFRDNFEGP